MSFWEIIWIIFISYVYIAYLFLIFTIIADLFRDHTVGGGAKFLWIVFLIFLPFLGVLVYLMSRGEGMNERKRAQLSDLKVQQDRYIQSVASTGPADQIASAKALLDSGAITAAEFDTLKAKALA